MVDFKYIKSLDLQYLFLRLVNKLKWDPSEAEEIIRKYKNFLILRCLYPKKTLVPTRDIDVVWHEHILHTKTYMKDCQEIFGKYLHHTPSSGSEKEIKLLEEAYINTSRLYRKHFGESYSHALDIATW